MELRSTRAACRNPGPSCSGISWVPGMLQALQPLLLVYHLPREVPADLGFTGTVLPERAGLAESGWALHTHPRAARVAHPGASSDQGSPAGGVVFSPPDQGGQSLCPVGVWPVLGDPSLPLRRHSPWLPHTFGMLPSEKATSSLSEFSLSDKQQQGVSEIVTVGEQQDDFLWKTKSA